MRPLSLILFLSSTVALAQQSAPDQLFTSAVEAQQRGDYPTAIHDYEKLLLSRPGLGEAHANLGAALAHTGQLDEAIAQYKLALPNAPDKDGVRLNLGLAYYKRGIAEFNQGASQGPNSQAAQPDPKAVPDLADAITQFQQLRLIRPKDLQLAILLAYCELPSGKASDALAMLTPLEADNAASQELQYVLGEAEIATGRRREGAARLAKLAEATQSPDVYMLAGSTLLDLNEIEPARKNLDAALRLNPSLPRINTLAGMARDKSGDQAAAEPAFRDALKLNPEDFDANLYLGAILYKRRAVDEARPFLDKALQLNPFDTMAEYESAMLSSTSNDWAQAAKLLESVVKVQPDWLPPHVQLATVYYRLHRPEDGAKERAIVDKLTADQQAAGPGKQ